MPVASRKRSGRKTSGSGKTSGARFKALKKTHARTHININTNFSSSGSEPSECNVNQGRGGRENEIRNTNE